MAHHEGRGREEVMWGGERRGGAHHNMGAHHDVPPSSHDVPLPSLPPPLSTKVSTPPVLCQQYTTPIHLLFAPCFISRPSFLLSSKPLLQLLSSCPVNFLKQWHGLCEVRHVSEECICHTAVIPFQVCVQLE